MITQAPSDSISPEPRNSGENDNILLELLEKTHVKYESVCFEMPMIYHPPKKSGGEGESAGFRRRSIVFEVEGELIAISNVIATYYRRAYSKFFLVGHYDPKKKHCIVTEALTVEGESIIHEDHPDVVNDILQQMTEAHALRKSFRNLIGEKEEKNDAEKTLRGLAETTKSLIEWLRDWNEKRRSILLSLVSERQIRDFNDEVFAYDPTGIAVEMRHDGVEPAVQFFDDDHQFFDDHHQFFDDHHQFFDDHHQFFDNPKHSDVFDGFFF